jgi:hypothetical protein
MRRPTNGARVTAQRLLAAAEAEIDKHATSPADGLCVTCRIPGPCPRRETPVAIFSRYHRSTCYRRHPTPA